MEPALATPHLFAAAEHKICPPQICHVMTNVADWEVLFSWLQV
jgi:hypothetical protein